MSSYYIKKLGSQELGSPRPDGSVSRGRYIYVTKEANGFFPHLSRTHLNDTVVVPIIAPFSDAKIYTRFVYHNDKYTRIDGSRDEFRLYLNKELDPEKSFFRVNDIVVFERIDELVDGELVPIYFVNIFKEIQPEYKFLQDIIEDSPIRGNHALINGQLNFLPSAFISQDQRSVIVPKDVLDDAKQKQQDIIAETEIQSIENSRGASLFNSVSFRDFVLLGYNYECAITNKAIRFGGLNNLEAAHIMPKAHEGSFLPCNGLALSRDMHWAFDKGFISISDQFTVIVHEKLNETSLNEFAGKKIFVPKDPFFQPEIKYLAYHRSNIFGLFQRSGMIRATNT